MQDGRLRALLSKTQEGNQFAQTHTLPSIVTCPLTGTRSEKCILNRFCHSVSVAECTYIQAEYGLSVPRLSSSFGTMVAHAAHLWAQRCGWVHGCVQTESWHCETHPSYGLKSRPSFACSLLCLPCTSLLDASGTSGGGWGTSSVWQFSGFRTLGLNGDDPCFYSKHSTDPQYWYLWLLLSSRHPQDWIGDRELGLASVRQQVL